MQKNLLSTVLLFSFLFSQQLWAFNCPTTVAEANALSDLDYSMAPMRCASQGIYNIPQRTVGTTSKWTTIKTTLDGRPFQPVKVPDEAELRAREARLPLMTENTIVCHPLGSPVGPICGPGQSQLGTRTYKPSPYTQAEIDSMSAIEHTAAVMRGHQQGYSVAAQQVKHKTVKVEEAPGIGASAGVGAGSSVGLGALPQDWNEAEYLRCNPDVADNVAAADEQAVRFARSTAQVSVAGLHYLMYGKKEGRSPAGGCGPTVKAKAKGIR